MNLKAVKSLDLVIPPSVLAQADQIIEYRLVELDARGRRLRAALAAVLVKADAPPSG